MEAEKSRDEPSGDANSCRESKSEVKLLVKR